LTVLPGITKIPDTKGRLAEEQETTEYSSREVKPAILLLGDLLRAHSTFLLHHASSMSALFVRTRRSKFVGILGRYWDTFLSSWNVLMHGNPANSLYGGIKVAACGELGMGVGEEERGSGEREVLEGFVGRIEGLVDVIVSKFGDAELETDVKQNKPGPAKSVEPKPSQPWLGSGEEPATEDGAIFLGTGSLSRKSLRDVTHWMEDLYRWGEYAYGVIDNPSSIRRSKKLKPSQTVRGKKDISAGAANKLQDTSGISSSRRDSESQAPQGEATMTILPPAPIIEGAAAGSTASRLTKSPSFKRGPGSFTSTDSESGKGNKFMQYLKFGYGTHWSIGGPSSKTEGGQHHSEVLNESAIVDDQQKDGLGDVAEGLDGAKKGLRPRSGSVGHYLIGLLGDFESDDDTIYPEDSNSENAGSKHQNSRLLLRTLTVELEREEDARAEADISIDLGNLGKEPRSMNAGSEHTGTSNASFESQDRNKTKKLRVVVYVKKPFIFVFLFELRTDTLALTSLYRSLHQQIQPLLKPLGHSTRFRASKPDLVSADGSTTPIFDLVWDPRLLTINSTIPNIPDPLLISSTPHTPPWSRIEALNTHMQLVNTYIASSCDRSELERTCKTSRGWWVVWTRVPDPEPPAPVLSSGKVKVPGLIAEDSMESHTSKAPGGLRPSTGVSKSRGTSTFSSSMVSGPAHPFLEATLGPSESVAKDKEIFLIRRASDYVAKPGGRFVSGASAMVQESGWTSGPSKLAQGIGVDTKRYIEGLLNLNR
jgi:hypothetical protein